MSFPDGVSYRRMQSSDLHDLQLLLPALLPGNWELEILQDLLLSSHRCRVLYSHAGVKNTVFGFVEYTVVADICEIMNIAIASHAQGAGLGRLLLSKVVQEARQAGCECCQLEVRRTNEAAIGLYVSQGFEMSGVRKNYYPAMQAGSVPEDALLYSLQLE